jgi:hypothetical protein
MPLEGSDQRHLQAAHGYIELGLFKEANAELEEIDAFFRHLPEVLVARVAIYHGLEKWELLSVVAKELVEWNPIALAASLQFGCTLNHLFLQ